jgi:hypothetical protein
VEVIHEEDQLDEGFRAFSAGANGGAGAGAGVFGQGTPPGLPSSDFHGFSVIPPTARPSDSSFSMLTAGTLSTGGLGGAASASSASMMTSQGSFATATGVTFSKGGGGGGGGPSVSCSPGGASGARALPALGDAAFDGDGLGPLPGTPTPVHGKPREHHHAVSSGNVLLLAARSAEDGAPTAV